MTTAGWILTALGGAAFLTGAIALLVRDYKRMNQARRERFTYRPITDSGHGASTYGDSPFHHGPQGHHPDPHPGVSDGSDYGGGGGDFGGGGGGSDSGGGGS